MYQFSKLCPKSKDFITFLTNSGLSRQKLTSVCMAKAIADGLELTSAPVHDVKQFFRQTLEIRVKQLISQINELLVLDHETILQYTRSFYTWRYRITYDPPLVICTNNETAIDDFFSVSLSVDRDALCEIAKEPARAMKIYNDTRSLLADINSMA